jgi:hypothetical protein
MVRRQNESFTIKRKSIHLIFEIDGSCFHKKSNHTQKSTRRGSLPRTNHLGQRSLTTSCVIFVPSSLITSKGLIKFVLSDQIYELYNNKHQQATSNNNNFQELLFIVISTTFLLLLLYRNI